MSDTTPSPEALAVEHALHAVENHSTGHIGWMFRPRNIRSPKDPSLLTAIINGMVRGGHAPSAVHNPEACRVENLGDMSPPAIICSDAVNTSQER